MTSFTDLDAPGRATAAQIDTDLLVVGAGPAGLAAAGEAAAAGLRVLLVDAGERPGGQYWRHGTAGLDGRLHHDVRAYAGLMRRVADRATAGRLDVRLQHRVWSIGVAGGTVTARIVVGTDPLAPAEIVVQAARTVLAPGAYDRQVPFPGWDLPGVMTVGGAQALLKGSDVAVGPRVLIAGTGPFLLPVAAGLAQRGSTVLGVLDANAPTGWLRQLSAVARHSVKVIEAAGYAATLARHRVSLRNRTVVVAAQGADRLAAVTVASTTRDGRIRPGTHRRIETDVLAVGFGFTAQTELPLAAGCDVHTTDDGTLAVTIDEDQLTTVPGVYAAGESTGIGGAGLAVIEGRLAGAAAARAAGLVPATGPAELARLRRRRERLRRFAAALQAVYPVPAGWLRQLTPDTVVCRCEEVTVAALDRAVSLGAFDTRTAKLLSRSGMGWCQGRICGYATACLVADRTGRPPDLASGASRPVATPVPLGLVAAGMPEPTESVSRAGITKLISGAAGPEPAVRHPDKEHQDMTDKPWHGVLVATALPWRDDDTPDLDAYAAHVAWLARNGCDGIVPNGSLGEYQQLTDEQRYDVVRTAVAAAPDGCAVMPGVAAYGARQARRHTEQAGEAGCPAVMLLPPNAYRASRADVLEHYRIVAEAGVPVVAYNNPIDTKVDLVPDLLAELFSRGYIVAVKEFSGDVRRFYELAELVPDLDVLAGSDDVAMELGISGAQGWISGYPNAFPASCVELWRAAVAGDVETALPLYRQLHPLLRWDSKTEFVQAIKLSMDLVPDAVDGGRCLPPRGPLGPAAEAAVRTATEKALAAGLS